MRAITRGSAMVATWRRRPPRAGHASTSRPKVWRNNSARATWRGRTVPAGGGALGAVGAAAAPGDGHGTGAAGAAPAGGAAAGADERAARGVVAWATRQQPRAASAPR